MSFTRTVVSVPAEKSLLKWLAVAALSLSGALAEAQTAPAVSTVVAFNLSNPSGNLVRGGDGALYGVNQAATSVTGGLVYRTTIDGSSVRTLYQLNIEDGVSPLAGLLIASDGLLYGSTKFGRASETVGTGALYRLRADGTGFTVFHRFAGYTATNQDLAPINTNGAYPEAELIEGTDGYLYGVTRAGGAAGTGVIFKVLRDGADFQVLRQLSAITSAAGSGITANVDGAVPLGPLVRGVDGYFYGTASAGGVNGRGTVFRIAFDGTGFQVLHEFTATTPDATTALLENADGATPLAGLTDGGDGFFYGVTSSGGETGQGVIFAISPDGGTFTVLHHFSGNGGTRPVGELLLGTDGKLYGTTSTGGQSSSGAATSFGTIFSIARAGTDFALLHSFDSTQGSAPASRLVELSSTVFVGTANNAGRCGYGTIFRYSGAGDTVTGNTRCGQSNNNNNGGGSLGPALLVLLGGIGWVRRRRRH